MSRGISATAGIEWRGLLTKKMYLKAPELCTYEGCERAYKARGYCSTHLRRSDSGHPPMDAPIADKRRGIPEQRFARKVAPAPDSDCIWWTDHIVRGYGQFRLRRGKQVGAHVFAWELVNGPVPDDLVLDHICHPIDGSCPGGEACLHRRCVNPDHLLPISRGDNSRRCVPVHLRPARVEEDAIHWEFEP